MPQWPSGPCSASPHSMEVRAMPRTLPRRAASARARRRWIGLPCHRLAPGRHDRHSAALDGVRPTHPRPRPRHRQHPPRKQDQPHREQPRPRPTRRMAPAHDLDPCGEGHPGRCERGPLPLLRPELTIPGTSSKWPPASSNSRRSRTHQTLTTRSAPRWVGPGCGLRALRRGLLGKPSWRASSRSSWPWPSSRARPASRGRWRPRPAISAPCGRIPARPPSGRRPGPVRRPVRAPRAVGGFPASPR